MAPAIGKISPEFRQYLDAMEEVDAAKCTNRKEADEILQKTEPVRFDSHSSAVYPALCSTCASNSPSTASTRPPHTPD